MPTVTEAELTDLLSRIDESADAFVRGDVRHCYTLFDHGEGYTLMRPDGGGAIFVGPPSEEDLDATSRFFTEGEATVEVEATYTSGDLVVVVAVERQHGRVGGLPDQDISLRVTLVFRRVGGRWVMLHRHADPLVRPMPLERLTELMRAPGT